MNVYFYTYIERKNLFMEFVYGFLIACALISIIIDIKIDSMK